MSSLAITVLPNHFVIHVVYSKNSFFFSSVNWLNYVVKKIYDIALSNMIKASVYTGEFKDNRVEQKVMFCICTEKRSNMKLFILYNP